MPNPQIYESAVLEAAAGKIINKKLLQWVEEVAVTCKPDRVRICDGSEQEYQLMTRLMLQSGSAVALNPQKRPNSIYVRSTTMDVARVEDQTFICSKTEDDAGPTNNWEDPARMKRELTDLAVHLQDRLSRHVRVVGPLQVASRRLARPQLEVGHVDVDDPLHQAEAVERVVGARVVDDRQLEAAREGKRQRFEDLRHDVLGRDPVDVVTADRLQLEHHLREPLGCDELALNFPRDVVVLAEDAPEVAAREEDRPRTVPAAEAVLLAEVREVGRDHRVPPDRAQTGDVGPAVDLAAARADDAALAEQLVRLRRSALELGPRERDGQHVRCSAAAVFHGSSWP